MASFAINLNYLRENSKAVFYHLSKGNYETLFLQDLVTLDDLEPIANCTKVNYLSNYEI